MSQIGQQIWGGSRDPLTHFTLYSSGIPRDFLVHGKPATAMETCYFDCLLVAFHNLCNSVARDEQTTSDTHGFPSVDPILLKS